MESRMMQTNYLDPDSFEKFIKAGVNHFVIRFWGKNYFGSIDKFASQVIPYFKEQNK